MMYDNIIIIIILYYPTWASAIIEAGHGLETPSHTHTHAQGWIYLSFFLSFFLALLVGRKKKFEDHIRSLEALSQVLEFLKYSVIILYMTAKC